MDIKLIESARTTISRIKVGFGFHPPVKLALEGLEWLIELYLKSGEAASGWAKFIKLVADRLSDITEASGPDPPPRLVKILSDLNETFEDIKQDITAKQKDPKLKKIAEAKLNAEEIGEYQTRIDEALSRFHLIANIEMFRALDKIRTEVLNLNDSPIVLTAMPDRPINFHGRDEVVKDIVDTISSKFQSGDSARIAITGPCGIGKTAVGLAVLHHQTIASPSQFSDRRHFIDCENLTSVSQLIRTLLASISVREVEGDPFEQLLTAIQIIYEPTMVLLDGFDRFWYSDMSSSSQILLKQIASNPKLCIIITMRGNGRPDETWKDFILDTLKPEDAISLFQNIAPGVVFGTDLISLVEDVDCVPLAVTLLARIAHSSQAQTADTLRKAWREQGSALLSGGKSEKGNSYDASIKLSLGYLQSMSPNNILPGRLLSTIALLPRGTTRACLQRLQDFAVESAILTLKNLALINESPSGRLRLLAPTRSYIMIHKKPETPDYQHVSKSFFELARKGGCDPGHKEYKGVYEELFPECDNIQEILLQLLNSLTIQHDLKDAVLAFSKFLRWTKPSTNLLNVLLARETKQGPSHLLAPHFQYRGEILLVQDKLPEAKVDFEKALSQFLSSGDILPAANCSKSISKILFIQGEIPSALATIEEARKLFEQANNERGVAQCYLSLGTMYHVLDEYEKAFDALQKAKTMFKDKLKSVHGAAQCRQVQGNVFLMKGDFLKAQEFLKQVSSGFSAIKKVKGVAQCSQSLGRIFILQDKSEDAKRSLQEALRGFESKGDPSGSSQCLELLAITWPPIKNEGWYIQDALSAVKIALLHAEATGNKLEVAKCHQSLGNLLLEEKDLKSGESYLKKARDQFLSIANKSGAAECLHSLGEVLMAHGVDTAEMTLQLAKKEFEDIGNQYGAACTIRDIANIYVVQGKSALARKYFIQCKELFTLMSLDWEVQRVEGELQKIRERQGHSRGSGSHKAERSVQSYKPPL